MLHVHCRGSPQQIGQQHGQQAKTAILGSIDFYKRRFRITANLEWDLVRQKAAAFEPGLRQHCPAYLEEMQAIADGVDLELFDIIALNVRTEITFGLFSDGCTALSWTTSDASFLAQNWDWDRMQKANLLRMTIEQPGKPTIRMITEAGVIGKIGMNTAGVGVCLNAIRAHGMDPTRLPCHLGLRMILESTSREEAVNRLQSVGIASACHMLVADASGAVGLEWSSKTLRKIEMNARGQIFHTNHWLEQHDGMIDTNWLPDSQFRLQRVQQLCNAIGERPQVDQLLEVFQDEENLPGSICRVQSEITGSETLFNIIMDLKTTSAAVRVGRPTTPDDHFVLSP